MMEKWRRDYHRFAASDNSSLIRFARCIKNRPLRALFYLRKYEATGSNLWKWLSRYTSMKDGNELCCKKLGAGYSLDPPIWNYGQ